MKNLMVSDLLSLLLHNCADPISQAAHNLPCQVQDSLEQEKRSLVAFAGPPVMLSVRWRFLFASEGCLRLQLGSPSDYWISVPGGSA